MKGNEEWNRRYSSNDFIYGLQPNEYLKSKLVNLAKGSLLLPGEGEGRNALWATKQGWEVTAFDYSLEAKRKADNLFLKHNLRVNYHVSDALSFKTDLRYDALSLIYMHLPSNTRKKFHESITSFLKPSGYLIMECFHPDQIHRTSGGPKNPDLLASIEEIKESFKTLHIIELTSAEVNLDEGELHKGKALVIRLFAQKKV